MDILIKGMDEIPEDGAVLVVRHDNGKAYIKHACTYGYSMELVELPAIQPDHNADIGKKVEKEDCVSRQAAIEIVDRYNKSHMILKGKPMLGAASIVIELEELPSAQPEIIRCKDCIYYDPPHVENNGVRYEYTEMPADAFDVLGTGLVTTEYGINIGGRCCRDYNAGYEDDKRVYVPENNHCGRGKRRTDG